MRFKRWFYRWLFGWYSFDVVITDRQDRQIIAGTFKPWEIPITFKIPGRNVYRPKSIIIQRHKGR